jgi:integrase
VFLTHSGRPWTSGKDWSMVPAMFGKLVDDLGLKQRGRGFYTLRHVFRTVADETLDMPAIDLIMGHTANDMASVYRERIADDRLRRVVNHVHRWLFGAKEKR